MPSNTIAPEQHKHLIEAILLAADAPLSVSRLRRILATDEQQLPPAAQIESHLKHLQQDWQGRLVELVELAGGWRFRTQGAIQPWIERLQNERAPRYSRAVLETLAIIAWRQPVTRGDIENIRGVSLSPGIVKTLEARGWIDTVGYRDTPGRPGLLATTDRFLDDLGLQKLSDLPELPEIERIIDFDDPQKTTPHPVRTAAPTEN